MIKPHAQPGQPEHAQAAAAEGLDWTAAYTDLQPRVCNYFRYRTGDDALADDLAAVTFERAWRGRHQYRRDYAAFATWLFAIARNVAASHFRRPRRREEPLDAAYTCAGPQSVEDEVMRREDHRQLATLLAGLPHRERELVELKYGAELTNRAIARLTGLSESNVGTLLNRIMRRLATTWDGGDGQQQRYERRRPPRILDELASGQRYARTKGRQSVIEVAIESVRVSTVSSQRVILLREQGGNRYAALFVGTYEAEALAMQLQGRSSARPFAYDLIGAIVAGMGGAVRRVEVASADGIYTAAIVVTTPHGEATFDARASDALNLAARTDAPILVNESLLVTWEDVEKTAQITNRDFSAGVRGWWLAGSHPAEYAIGVDTEIAHDTQTSGSLRCTVEPPSKGFGTLMQMVPAAEYRRARVRMSAWVRADSVGDWAGLWFRVDDAEGARLGFDNMGNRKITGTRAWAEYSLVLDVPEEAEQLAYGILLNGRGQVWLSGLTFEHVGEEIAVTNMRP